MGDNASTSGQGEIDGIVRRLAVMARADPRRPHNGAGETQAVRLDAALEFLPQLKLRTLRVLEHYVSSPGGLAAAVVLNRGQADGLGVANLLIRHCSPPSVYRFSRTAASIDADLLDLLTFSTILDAHGETMFDKCLADVKKRILGLSAEEALADQGFARYGVRGVFSVLDISVSLATLQLSKTAAHITPRMGYAGVDARDDCHCMTAGFARWILRTAPDPGKVSGLAANGRLAKFGISPADLDPEKLRAELSKVDVDAEVGILVGPDTDGSQPGPAGTGGPETNKKRRPYFADIDDGGRRSFEVTTPPTLSTASTAGDAFEKNISRRDSNAAIRRTKALFWVACPLAAIAISLWIAGPMIGELLAGPPLNAWKGLGAFVLAEALGGCLIALGVSSWLDLRASGFFLAARELNHFTVLQGRRDDEFLQALRVLRPRLFDRSATAGLPRRFTLCFDREGAQLIGGGTHAAVVAAFHWLHVREILAEPPVRGHQSKRGQRVVLLVRHEGTDVRLAFPLERAKVAWTSRTFLESDPVTAALALVQGMRSLSSREGPGAARNGIRKMTSETEERSHLLLWHDAVLEGTDYEKEALEYEARLRPPLALASSAFIRSRHSQIVRGLAVVAVLCAAGPSILMLFLR